MTDLSSDVAIHGSVDPAFALVEEVFRANFAAAAPVPEIGAAYSLYADGRCVADLWGGVADPQSGRLWEENMLVPVWSTTKGVLAIALARLVEQGRLSYDDPVARHWPEFAAEGKAGITLAQVLSHQSGVNGFAVPTAVSDFADWSLVTQRLADQAPFWEPGTETSYHAMTFGFIIGEVMHRITGKMPGEWIAEDLCAPLGLDFGIGVPQSEWTRIATLTPPPPPPADRPKPDPIAFRAISNPMILPAEAASPLWRTAQVPAANGHTNARSLARLWGAIGNSGEVDGTRILSPAMIETMRTPFSTGPDLMMGAGSWGAGVMINRGGLFGPGEGAFGGCGFGGSQGYADPELGLGAGYTPNRMFGGALQDPRAMALANVAAECAGRAGR